MKQLKSTMSAPGASVVSSYEQFVLDTCVHTDDTYPFLGLAGECGEVMEQVKKAWRGRGPDWMLDHERVALVTDELSDVLWYLTRCAYVLNISMEELMKYNMRKLNARRDQS